MSLEAEALLAATGLLQLPDRTAMTASRTLVSDLRKQLLAVLDRDDQSRMRVNDQTENYLKRLALPFDYDICREIIAKRFGDQVATDYQLLHQDARRTLYESYPAQEVDTARGTRPQPPDPELLAQWLLEVDTVENQRLVSDLASGAILNECVDRFKATFPKIFNYLLSELHAELASRPDDWLPPIWLEMALATFTGKPQVGAPPEEPAADNTTKSSASLDLKTASTPAQTAQESGLPK